MPTFTELEDKATTQEESQPDTAPLEATQPSEQQETVGDPFEELLNLNAQDQDPFAVPDTVGQTQTAEQVGTEKVAAEEMVPKADQNQYQYWQSQYDKAQRELESMKSSYEGLKDIEPIAKYIKDNPAVLDGVESSLSSGMPTGKPEQANQVESLKKPERPTKPANYDAIDAYSDPDSASYKYRETVDSYRDEMIAFQEHRNTDMMTRMENEYRARAEKQQLDGLRTQLGSTFEFSREQTEDFIKVMSDPNSMSLDNLVSLYKMKQAPDGEVAKNLRKAEQMRAQNEKLKIAPSVGVAPAEAKAERPAEESIMDAMIAEHNKTNPWT